MAWMLLMPREVELLMRPLRDDDDGNDNTRILRELQGQVDAVRGDLDLTDGQLERLQRAAHNWRGGYENRLKSLLSAAERTAGGRVESY